MSGSDARRAGPSRREILIGATLLGTAALAFARQPHAIKDALTAGQLEKLIPMRIGPWSYESRSGLVLPPSDQMSERLYQQLLTRTYLADDGTGVMLLIAYSGKQDGMLQVHRPEVCYPASGYTLLDNREHDLPLDAKFTLPTRFIVAENRARTEQLIYWTRIGPDFPTRWVDQRMAVISENMKGLIPDGLLVRISTLSPDADAAMAILDRFTRALISSVGPRARASLIGPNG